MFLFWIFQAVNKGVTSALVILFLSLYYPNNQLPTAKLKEITAILSIYLT